MISSGYERQPDVQDFLILTTVPSNCPIHLLITLIITYCGITMVICMSNSCNPGGVSWNPLVGPAHHVGNTGHVQENQKSDLFWVNWDWLIYKIVICDARFLMSLAQWNAFCTSVNHGLLAVPSAMLNKPTAFHNSTEGRNWVFVLSWFVLSGRSFEWSHDLRFL